jgi:hypothetical protein
VSGSLQHPIDRTEMGVVPEPGTACGFSPVWTGTLVTGAAFAGDTCSGWTDASGTATMGASTAKGGTWTDACQSSCANTASLYCVEQ